MSRDKPSTCYTMTVFSYGQRVFLFKQKCKMKRCLPPLEHTLPQRHVTMRRQGPTIYLIVQFEGGSLWHQLNIGSITNAISIHLQVTMGVCTVCAANPFHSCCKWTLRFHHLGVRNVCIKWLNNWITAINTSWDICVISVRGKTFFPLQTGP